MRAEPKIVTAGLARPDTASKPSKNSSAMRASCSRSAPSSLWRRRRSSNLERALEVGGRHRDREEHGEPDVDRACGAPLGGRPLVVRRSRRVLALAPSTPELEAAEDEDDDEDGVRMPEGERDEPCEADRPERRVHGRDSPSSVERHDRNQIEEVEEESGKGERYEEVRVDGFADAPDGHRSERSEDGPGKSDPRFLPRVVRHLFHADDRSEERNEERCRRGHALAPELEDMAELVHQDQEDEADAESGRGH